MDFLFRFKSTRINWIDIAKFFGIFFIILGHVYIGDSEIRRILYTFHVPLFFILSGFTFRAEEQKTFILKKIRTLYIPYLVTATISIFIYLILGSLIGQDVSLSLSDLSTNLFGMIYANVSVGNMIWNRPLWFIPAIFVCLIITNLIFKIKSPFWRNITAFLLTALGMILSLYKIYLPLQTETALSMLIWVFLGINTKEFLISFSERTKKTIIFLIALILLIGGLIVGWINGPIEVMIDYYTNNIILYFVAAYSLSYSVILFSILIGRQKILEYIGQNTLFLLLWSKFPILLFQEIVPGFSALLLSENLFVQTTAALGVTIITILICLIGQNILWILTDKIIPKTMTERYRMLFK